MVKKHNREQNISKGDRRSSKGGRMDMVFLIQMGKGLGETPIVKADGGGVRRSAVGSKPRSK